MEDLKLFNRILELKSLKPSRETNRAFSELVRFCEHNNPVSLEPYQVEKLRELSSIAEYEMEAFWAKKIIASKDPQKELEKFWYYKNYEQLVELEYSSITCVCKDVKNFLFIGGGPLPLTAILLCKKYGLTCTVLEKDLESYAMSVALLQVLGLSDGVQVLHIDAEDYTKYSTFSLIYLAAMVGQDEVSKNKIISLIHHKIKKGKLLLCRSSHGTRKLLYVPIAKDLFKEIRPVLEVRPYNSIINSFFILQKT